MNVLILSDLIAYSGVGQYMVQLGGGISEDPTNRVVLASPYIERTDIPNTVELIKLPETNQLLKYLRQLHRIVKTHDIDVVHCNHRKQTFIMRLYQLIYGRIATVWTCHTVPYPTNWLKRMLGYYGHKTIAISTEAQNWMHKELHIQFSKIDKITNGVDNGTLVLPKVEKHKLKEEFFSKYFNEAIDGKDTKIIIAHGRLHPIKGLDLLIKAFAQLDETQRQNVKLVLSGNTKDSYYIELASLIEKKHLEKSVYFTGWITSKDILSIADLMIQPSYREGFPLAALEAFFMKVPVVRSKVGGYEDMKDYCIGIPAGDVEAIRDEIERCLNTPSMYHNMIEKAYYFAMQEGTVRVMVNKTVETYKRAIELCQS